MREKPLIPSLKMVFAILMNKTTSNTIPGSSGGSEHKHLFFVRWNSSQLSVSHHAGFDPSMTLPANIFPKHSHISPALVWPGLKASPKQMRNQIGTKKSKIVLIDFNLLFYSILNFMLTKLSIYVLLSYSLVLQKRTRP